MILVRLVDCCGSCLAQGVAIFQHIRSDMQYQGNVLFLLGMRYDEDGTFISSWIPALAALPAEMRHMPFSSLKGKDVDYPQPIVEFSSQIGLPPKRERNKGM